MRLLDRYLFRELLAPLGFCLGGFLIFWIAFDLFGRVDEFQEWRLNGQEILLYYLYGLPELLNTALPVALLLAMLYALTTHARHNELIAMRAAGLSLWRICMPYFGIGLFLSLGLLAINERLMVDAPEWRAELTRRHSQEELRDSGKWKERVNFWNPVARRDWSLGAFHLESAELRQPRVAMPLPPGAYREVVAEWGRWTNGFWRLTNGFERIHRAADDPLPAEKPKPIFTVREMGGDPAAVLEWPGTPLMESNVVVAVTNLLRKDDATGSQWQARSLSVTNELLEEFRFSAPLEPGARRVVIAESGVWTNGLWRFYNAREFLYRSATDGDVLDQLHAELDLPEFEESPNMIGSEVRVGELLSRTKVMRRPTLPVRDLTDYLMLHPNLGKRDRALLETQLHARMAAPWTCLVVSVIAIPFGAPSGRRNIFYGVAGSLALGFLFFAVQRMGFAVGQSGLVPAWLGAWLPNLCFGTIGLILTARVR
jgi:lipopolysaccharide export LptBFGC system permease protein LptF